MNPTVHIYIRSEEEPALPSTPVSYDANEGVLTGLDNGWAQGIPPLSEGTLFYTMAVAFSDTIQPEEWATPVRLAK